MKKGDARRSELLATAERLFYTKGYEKTSVQDILTEMNFSKGGFYHHFDSKLAVLEAICQQRAQESCEKAKEMAEGCGDGAINKLNAVLRAAEILTSGQQSFVALLLQVAYCDDGALMREKMKKSQLTYMQPVFEEILSQGVGEQVFFISDVQAYAQMLLRMNLMFTDEIALLLNSEENEARILEEAVRKLNLYRAAVERILLAPFGSIVLLEAKELQILVQSVLRDRIRRRADALLNK